MSDQPPEDVGTAQMLLVVAVVVAILAIGTVLLVYDRTAAPERALQEPPSSLRVPMARRCDAAQRADRRATVT
jgi:hypothetical protein